MSKRKQRFLKTDLTRAIKAVEDAGRRASRVTINLEGEKAEIVIEVGPTMVPGNENLADEWKVT